MSNLVISVVIIAIIGAACMYIYKAKKSGAKCIGCPASKNCSSKSGNGSLEQFNGGCG